MEELHLGCLGVVDIGVVAEQEQGAGIDRPDGIPHTLVRGDVPAPPPKCDGKLVRRSVFLQRSVGQGAFPGPGLGIELPGVRLFEGKVDKHLGLLRVDLVVLVLVQVGNDLLLFSLEDELEAVRVDTLGLAAFSGFSLLTLRLEAWAKSRVPIKGTASIARKRRTGVRGLFILGRY